MTTAGNNVKLDVFEGPLDLLLYLIKKNDLNIHDIPLSQITNDFLQYLGLLKDLNLNIAGEFLVMAATLMQIKARTLLPAPSREDEETVDPRADLVHRLLEYQRFKEASRHLESRLHATKDIHFRGSPTFGETDYTMDASLFDLLDAFRDVLKNLRPGCGRSNPRTCRSKSRSRTSSRSCPAAPTPPFAKSWSGKRRAGGSSSLFWPFWN